MDELPVTIAREHTPRGEVVLHAASNQVSEGDLFERYLNIDTQAV